MSSANGLRIGFIGSGFARRVQLPALTFVPGVKATAIASGHRVPEQILRMSQLVMGLAAHGELHLVAVWRERRHLRRSVRATSRPLLGWSLQSSCKRQFMAIRIAHVEVTLAPARILRSLRFEPLLLEMTPG